MNLKFLVSNKMSRNGRNNKAVGSWPFKAVECSDSISLKKKTKN